MMKSKKCLSEYKDHAYTSLLLGNGLLKSHPTEREKFDFKYEDLAKELVRADLNDLKCPEDVLNTFRIELSLGILKMYIQKFEAVSPEMQKLRSYVQQFQNIFTTNYDPITYKTIFAGYDAVFNDGFVNPEKNSIEVIEKILKKDGCKGIYYLHGAFHIIYIFEPNPTSKRNTKHLYKKITATTQNLLLKEINDKHEQIIGKYRKNETTSNEIEEHIFCVLEAKSRYKAAVIKEDPYLVFCLEELGKQRKILTLGCSFHKDGHLLEKVLLNENLEDFAIGVFDRQDEENIQKTYEEIKNSLTNRSSEKQQRLQDSWNNKTTFYTRIKPRGLPRECRAPPIFLLRIEDGDKEARSLCVSV